MYKLPDVVGTQKYVIYSYQMKNLTVFNINIREGYMSRGNLKGDSIFKRFEDSLLGLRSTN